MTNYSEIITALEDVFKETYRLYHISHHHHWNIEGARFLELHTLFESYYTDNFQALDVIAERIRSLGAYVYNTHEMTDDLDVENFGDTSDERTRHMIAQILTAHQDTIKSINTALKLADEMNDSVTDGILSERLTIYEKNVWILNSLLA